MTNGSASNSVTSPETPREALSNARETPKRDRPVIAIDGPAGAGKSTLAAHLARRFGFLNLETGAMYRALALKAIENDFGFDEETPLLDLAALTKIKLEPQMDGNRVVLDGTDVSRRIREQDVTSGASQISVHPRLRAWMVGAAARAGSRGRGGDGGARYWDGGVSGCGGKDFSGCGAGGAGEPALPAGGAGGGVNRAAAGDAAAIVADLKERDHRDRSRAESPLAPAADAVLLDSTTMSLDEVLHTAERIVREHLAGRDGGDLH